MKGVEPDDDNDDDNDVVAFVAVAVVVGLASVRTSRLWAIRMVCVDKAC